MSFQVGLTTRRYSDPARQNRQGTAPRPLVTDIWYPAVQGAKPTPVLIGAPDAPLFVAGEAARDVGLVAGPKHLPTIVVSHGTGATTLQLGWLASALAAQGYIVAGVNHHGNTAIEPYMVEGFARIWERPRDASVLLDCLLADELFGPRVNPARIGAAGFSLGGYTVLALGGARLDLQGLRDTYHSTGRDLSTLAPPEYPDPQGFGVYLERTISADTAHQQSFRDERVRAVFAIAPTAGEAVTAAGLADINVPVQIIAGTLDANTLPRENAQHYAASIRTAELVMLDGVGHYTFLAECTDLGRELLPVLCFDHAGIARAEVHRRVSAMAVAFFRQHLG